MSIRALVSGVFDYAGLFPPASLSLEEAWRRFAEYRQGPQRWVASAFVCPAAKFEPLAELLRETPPARPGEPWPVALLVGSPAAAAEGPRLWARELATAAQFGESLPAGRFEVTAVEARLSPGADCAAIVDEVLAAAEIALPWAEGARTFLEIPRQAPWPRTARDAAEGIGRLRADERGQLGLKLRTGGLEAAAFPSSEEVAEFLVACRDARVAWKATAGLHHPYRHTAAGLGCKMHGFLNLLVAVVLAESHALDTEELIEILEDERPTSFAFDEDQLAWRDLTAPLPAIRQIRETRLLSIGSCSIEEPLEGIGGLLHSA